MSAKKKVIFTALTGNYDALKQPVVVRDDWDYICFTDREGQDGVWQFRRIPFEGNDLVRGRQVKMQPHLVLPEYSVSLWMDANIRIAGNAFYECVERAMAEKPVFATLPHGQRDCVFEELCTCYRTGRIPWRMAWTHLNRLMRMRMPRHYGLYEMGVILREHNHPDVKSLDDAWWNLFKSCPLRDQLSFTPVLACPEACGNTGRVSPFLLFGEGRNVRNVDFIEYAIHLRGGGPVLKPFSYALRKLLVHLLWLRIKCYRP